MYVRQLSNSGWLRDAKRGSIIGDDGRTVRLMLEEVPGRTPPRQGFRFEYEVSEKHDNGCLSAINVKRSHTAAPSGGRGGGGRAAGGKGRGTDRGHGVANHVY
jgi:hypothetical protein